MPAMFPSMVTSGDDPNRKVTAWRPGDPTPRPVIAAFALLLFTAAIMVLTGLFLLFMQWDRQPVNSEDAAQMEFVMRNTRILGGVNVVLGLAIAFFARGVRDGYRGKRRLVLWLSLVAMFFLLAGWVYQFTNFGQAILALLLAVGNFLAFRPQVDPFFDAGHRLDGEAPVEGDGTLPGDVLRK